MSTVWDIEGKTLQADACFQGGDLIVNVYIPDDVSEDDAEDVGYALMSATVIVEAQ